jgi:hypothetical protein
MRYGYQEGIALNLIEASKLADAVHVSTRDLGLIT